MEYKRPAMTDLFTCSKHGHAKMRVVNLPEFGKDCYTHVCTECDREENLRKIVIEEIERYENARSPHRSRQVSP